MEARPYAARAQTSQRPRQDHRQATDDANVYLGSHYYAPNMTKIPATEKTCMLRGRITQDCHKLASSIGLRRAHGTVAEANWCPIGS